MPYKKKLIEVAIPLEAINRESAREKSIRHGHPSTLHIWWARRPLAACRAVLFASLVDDPSAHLDKFPTEEAQEAERQRLFTIIEELVKWENSGNEKVLEEARREIMASTDGNPPPVYDPFAGGGSIPLEAQRLGLKAFASDLNPVAVLITKAMIEIPPRFKDRPPVHPGREQEQELIGKQWRGAAGLAEDVRYYGQWMRDEAFRRIGRLYPTVSLPQANGGGEASVIAWLWARTVTCPNPACQAEMPLVRSFWLSQKKGKEAWVEPVVDRDSRSARVRFRVRTGKGKPAEGTVNRGGATCLVCGTPVPFPHVRSEGKRVGLGARLLAIVAKGPSGRVYLPPAEEQARVAAGAEPDWVPDGELPNNPRNFNTPIYGIKEYADLFTPRQLVALGTFSGLVSEARKRVEADAIQAGLSDDGQGLEQGGSGARAYAEAVSTYLAFAVDRSADAWSSIASWRITVEATRNTFARQAIPMVWDYAEANPFSDSCGNWLGASVDWIYKVLKYLPAADPGRSKQKNAEEIAEHGMIFSTDPPYYDNIGYADLSDFFYVWLRRSLRDVYPELFSTLLVPKKEELVATPYRFEGDKQEAKRFFEQGLLKTFVRIHAAQHPGFPLTVYYAFKQAETSEDTANGGMAVASTGWETMLAALLRAGFSIVGTWPIRTERAARSVAIGTNALASSIVLVCRQRPESAPTVTRKDFLKELKEELPSALRTLQKGNIAPVDLAQTAIGPGMAVFSRYARVVEADGSAMSVRMALALINQVLDEVLAEQEGEFDPDTRWALAWFQQFGTREGPFGEAETLCKAKNVSVQGLATAGVLTAAGGRVRLVPRDRLPADWDPATDRRLTVWETVQHLIRVLETEGEAEAAALLKALGSRAEAARDLAYRLYAICERKSWAQEALAYNGLIASWTEVSRIALSAPAGGPQGELDL